MANQDNLEVIQPQPLEVYEPFRRQLADFKEEESKLVFDYEDKQGNKDARSHVYKLRKSKTAVDNARKEAKSEHLETGRKIDAQAKSIIAEVQEMIDVHQDKLDEIEQREKDRIAAIEQRLSDLEAPFDPNIYAIGQLKERLAEIKAVTIDESFEEFANKAATVKDQSITALEKHIEAREKAEAEQIELAQLRAEKEQREKSQREAQIADDARKEAEAEAEQRESELMEKAAADKKAAKGKAERAALELKLEKERADKQRLESEKRELELKSENERLAREAGEREVQTKKVQMAIKDLSSAIESASGKTIELKLTTAKTLLTELEK